MKKLVALVAAAMLLAGCAATAVPASEPSASLPEYTPRELPEVLHCGGQKIPRDAFVDPVPASNLPADVAAGIEGSGWLEAPILSWSVASQSAEYVVLWRELSEDEIAEGLTYGDQSRHSSVVFSTGPAAMASPTPWSYYGGGPCAMRIPLQGLGEGDLMLDPAHPAEPEDTTIHLLINERVCASGESAEGRVEIVDVRESSTAVELVVGVRPRLEDVALCPGNPNTPFEIELAEPLGDRQILDGAIVPAIEVAEPLPW